MTYFNTTRASGEQLDLYRQQAATQDDIVMNVFYGAGTKALTPEEVQDSHPKLRAAPLTSIRRSITNLTQDGLLEKTAFRGKGRYGRPVYRWKLALYRVMPL